MFQPDPMPSPWSPEPPAPDPSQGSPLQGYQGDASAYPVMTNSYGMGQAQASPGAASGPNYMTKPTVADVPNQASRGFSPWSLMGESNARGG